MDKIKSFFKRIEDERLTTPLTLTMIACLIVESFILLTDASRTVKTVALLIALGATTAVYLNGRGRKGRRQ